jgi:hypothetical protein|tara:strand:+ start:1990 stop:2214 length:225 start_codon:yes stop_codon:yes gene_type:complete
MTYQEYEAKYDTLMKTFLRGRYPEGNIPGTIITPEDLTNGSTVNQIVDLEEAHPEHAWRTYWAGSGRRDLDEIT